MLEGKRYYAAGITRLISGIVFLMAAPQAKISWVAVIYGLGHWYTISEMMRLGQFSIVGFWEFQIMKFLIQTC